MNVQNVLPRDAIPSIDDPTFGSAYFGEATDEMVVVDGDPPRAYPLRILSYHEIVNDIVDGQPVTVTWCPICWSAVVYDPVVDGQRLTFGVSGKLADDALVMYDRETESEWQQTTGRAIAGEFEGAVLSTRSATVRPFEQFRADHPDGLVLQPVREGQSPAAVYDMAPYEAYADRDAFGLHGMRGEGEPRSWGRTDLDAKTIVLGVEIDGNAVGYPLPVVESESGVVTDTIGRRDIVVLATADSAAAFERPDFDLERRDGQLYGDGTTWDPATGRSADGRALQSVPARRLFAFAWQDAHGPAAFYLE